MRFVVVLSPLVPPSNLTENMLMNVSPKKRPSHLFPTHSYLVDGSCLALDLLGRDGDGDGLSGIKVLLAPVATRNCSLGDEGTSGSIVGKHWGDSGEGATVGALDDDVGTARVELTVTLVVVPDPVEDGRARWGAGGDFHVDSVGAAGGGLSQAVAELVLDDLLDHERRK